MSFRRKYDVTLSNPLTDVILQLQMSSASARFPHTFKTVKDLRQFPIQSAQILTACG